MPIDDRGPSRGTTDAARRQALMRLRRRQMLDRRASAMRAAVAATLVTFPPAVAAR